MTFGHGRGLAQDEPPRKRRGVGAPRHGARPTHRNACESSCFVARWRHESAARRARLRIVARRRRERRSGQTAAAHADVGAGRRRARGLGADRSEPAAGDGPRPRRTRRHPARRAIRAGPRRQHPGARPRPLVRWPLHRAGAGQLRRPVGRSDRQEAAAARRGEAGAGGILAAGGRHPGVAAAVPGHLRRPGRVLGLVPGRRDRRRGLARPLLRHGRRRPEPQSGHRDRGRALRGDRPAAARPRPQHRAGRPGAGRHAAAGGAAARPGRPRLLRQPGRAHPDPQHPHGPRPAAGRAPAASRC